jgi:hypothetical protein
MVLDQTLVKEGPELRAHPIVLLDQGVEIRKQVFLSKRILFDFG